MDLKSVLSESVQGLYDDLTKGNEQNKKGGDRSGTSAWPSQALEKPNNQ